MNDPNNRDLTASVWVRPPERVLLDEGEVHLWLAVWDRSDPAPESTRWFSREELARAERFHFDRDRRRFAFSRVFLRTVLASYLAMEPEEVDIRRDSLGKPHLHPRSPLSFNLSHSEDFVLLAVAASKAVGVDVERITERVDGEELARRYFSSSERDALLALPRESRGKAFFDCWTRKEAYVKARGRGLSLGLDGFSVSLAPGEPAALLGDDNEREAPAEWMLVDLPLGPEYSAALAVEGPVRRLEYWRWSKDWAWRIR